RGADFVVQQPDGPPLRLSLRQLRRLEGEGRVLYFAGARDSHGLRPSLHPLLARSSRPDRLIILVDLEPGSVPVADRFPTLEALESSGSGPRFGVARAGPRGARALAAEAEGKREETLAAGWALLKLQSYAFALDAEGHVEAVYVSKEELEKARRRLEAIRASEECREGAAKPLPPQCAWRLFEARELSLGLAADGSVVEAVLAGGVVYRRGAVATWLRGELLAAAFDRRGRLVRYFTERRELERAAAGWWVEDVEGGLREPSATFSPTERVRGFVDPGTAPSCPPGAPREEWGAVSPETCGLRVVLGRSLLQRLLAAAEGAAREGNRWAYMPWNFPELALELPRGVSDAVQELRTGFDPNQEGYVARAHLHRAEGGATPRHDLISEILRRLSPIRVIPDRVERFHDPSQFPASAVRDGELTPGRWDFEAGVRTEDGARDLVVGAQGWRRRAAYAREDIEEARGRVLAAFEGGVRSSFVETVRGRAGAYPEAKVEQRAGRFAMEQALRQLAGLADPAGDARLAADPRHLSVDRVVAEVQVRLGALQYQSAGKRYLELAEALEAAPRAASAEEERRVSDAAEEGEDRWAPLGVPEAPAGKASEEDIGALEASLQEALETRGALSAAAAAALPLARKAARASAFPLAPLLAHALPLL
ncbi:MAG: hypothetical protein HY554_17605, partial [Elusimicrobia bacterium]|nr:hypothetical protein [Elusimicrobiota bacterium]